MGKIIFLLIIFIFCLLSDALALQVWHLEDQYGGSNWFAIIIGLFFLFMIIYALYEKFSKIAPLIGTFIFGYLTYSESQEYFCSYLMVVAFGILTLFSLLAAYYGLFVKDSESNRGN